MSRLVVRQLNQVVKAGADSGAALESGTLSQESALSLLTRSIDFGHGHLAVIRLVMAVQLGAEIPEPHWRYCRTVATSPRADDTLRALYRDAASAAAAQLH